MEALAFAGALLALVCAGAAGYQITGGFMGFLLFAGLLGWAWHTRDRVPGAQARTTLVAALASVVLGFADTFSDAALPLAATDRGAAELLIISGLALMVPGLAAFIWAARALARAKGRSGWLGLLGIFNVIGYAVVVFLPPAAADARAVPEVAG